MRNRPIRLTNTALGTIWVECYKPESLDFHPWYHETCHLAGEKLPFFRVVLRRVKGRWTIEKFNPDPGMGMDPNAPKWPRGAREKVPGLVLGIGAAWAAANENLIRERGIEALELEVKDLVGIEGRANNLGSIRRAIAHAESIDRLDLLEPIRPLISALANEFS